MDKVNNSDISELNDEKVILHKGLVLFNSKKINNTSLKLKQQEKSKKNNNQIDAIVQIILPEKKHEFAVKVKKNLTKTSLNLSLQQFGRFPHTNKMLITNYINPKMAERLIENNIAFLDLAGNAYIKLPSTYIQILGNKLAKPLQQQKPSLLFQKTGLKLIFLFLSVQKSINWPYRKIASHAGVAIGSVGKIIKELKEQNYIVQLDKKKYQFIDNNKLIDRWVIAYPEQLRPKLLIGKYKLKQPNNKISFPEETKIYWSGERATQELYPSQIKPTLITIYTPEHPNRLILHNNLMPTPQGNIEILEVFWNFIEGETVVPHLLIYADLLATGDPRNIEEAQKFRDMFLSHE